MRPIAFRITDFRSIIDSHECRLSGDGITVLAGQNESGKTAVLTALRDFDLGDGVEPLTEEYQPEDRPEARPQVSVEFEFNYESVRDKIEAGSRVLPSRVENALRQRESIWVRRDLIEGKFHLDEELTALWAFEDEAPPPEGHSLIASAERLAIILHPLWPTFVYFDAFEDSLPRRVAVDTVIAELATKAPKSGKAFPRAVLDFIALSGIDVDRVGKLASTDKLLGNYLQDRCASITGDFLSYWKTGGGQESVELRVKHMRDAAGQLQLGFFVHDHVDQYPEQRSRGFVWFLSFYLRLAAAQKQEPDRLRLLLIDEPGSYLHARAQRDVLHLLEDRIATQEQVIFSTHSQYLIPRDRLHRLRVVVKPKDRGTIVLDKLTHPDLRGDDFADTLSPIIDAIGMDVRDALSMVKPRNVIIEGISDLLYLAAAASFEMPELLSDVNLFPGFGAPTVHYFASLFLGWGLPFSVLLDRDAAGDQAADRLKKDLLLKDIQIVRLRNAIAIEDLFSSEDFGTLLRELDSSLKLKSQERPSEAVKRLGVDKVLLAAKYSELVSKGKYKPTLKTQEGMRRLLTDLAASIDAQLPMSAK